MRTSLHRLGLCLALLFSMAVVRAPVFSAQDGGRYQKTLTAAQAGDQNSQYQLANMFELGLAPRQDYKAAAHWYRKAASQGHVKAQFKLGYMYHLGRGIPQDHKQAAKWYRLAAQGGNKYAQNNFGDLLQNGQGVPQDLKEAEIWFGRAAAQGFPFAFYSMGGLYEKSHRDLTEACKWYLLAANHGVEEATERIGFLGPRLGAEGMAEARERARLHRFPQASLQTRNEPRTAPLADRGTAWKGSDESAAPSPITQSVWVGRASYLAIHFLMPLVFSLGLFYAIVYGFVLRKRGRLLSDTREKLAAIERLNRRPA